MLLKTRSYLSAIAAFALLFANLPLYAQGIEFEHSSWADILAKAKKENKPVFLDAFTTWCGPCKYMARNVFTDETVGNFYNKNFINAKIDMEAGEGIRLAQQYEVSAYPTLFYISGDGELLHVGLGSRGTTEFIKLGEEALDPKARLASFIKTYNDGSRDPEFLRNYIARMDQGGRDFKDAAKQYWKTQSDDELLNRGNWTLIKSIVYDADSREFNVLVKRRAEYIAKYTADSVNEKIFAVYFDALITAAREDKTNVKFNQLKEKISATGFERSDKLNLTADMEVYKLKQDWKKYAPAAVKYLAKFGGKDANELNNEAWTFYEKIDDKGLLKKALAWSKRSIEIEKSYSYMDTYASLWYKIGNKKEALKYANEAIALAQTGGKDASGTMELLGKIRQMK
ncbi:MAG: thioredoxin family protein [Bacteroidota bacterium]